MSFAQSSWSGVHFKDRKTKFMSRGSRGMGDREGLPVPASLRPVPRPFVHPAFPSISMQEPKAVADQGHENKITSFIPKKM